MTICSSFLFSKINSASPSRHVLWVSCIIFGYFYLVFEQNLEKKDIPFLIKLQRLFLSLQGLLVWLPAMTFFCILPVDAQRLFSCHSDVILNSGRCLKYNKYVCSQAPLQTSNLSIMMVCCCSQAKYGLVFTQFVLFWKSLGVFR